MKLSGVYTSLDKCIDREWRQKEATKKELSKTRERERKAYRERKKSGNVSEKSFRTRLTGSLVAFGGSRVVAGVGLRTASFSRDRHVK